MYSYTNKTNHRKARLISSLALLLTLAAIGTSYYLSMGDKKDEAVSTKDVSVPVIALPSSEEKAIRPYKVEAAIVLDYYDGEETEAPSMTKFEGTYRANQGIDYAYQEEAFDVLAIFSGKVIDVKEDPLFGHSCTIQSDDVLITYQSLQDMKLSVGDEVKQGDVLSLASTNIYNKELGNHVHIVVEKNGERMNPEDLYDKKLNELS